MNPYIVIGALLALLFIAGMKIYSNYKTKQADKKIIKDLENLKNKLNEIYNNRQ